MPPNPPWWTAIVLLFDQQTTQLRATMRRHRNQILAALVPIAAGVAFLVAGGGIFGPQATIDTSRGVWFISPDGDDTNVGSNPFEPWQSFNHAVNVATEPAAGDTFFLMTGTWEGALAPLDQRFRLALNGDFETPTVMKAYRGATPVIDGTVHDGQATGAFHFQDRWGWRIEGVTFLNYFDHDTTSDVGWVIQQRNFTTNTGLDTIPPVDVISCTFTVDDRGSLGPDGRSKMPIRYFSTGSAQGEDVILAPKIIGNRMERIGDDGLRLGFTPHALIKDNYIASELRWNDNPVDGPDGIIIERMAAAITIIGNEIIGFDHGMNLRGHGLVVRENLIHDLNDDFVFITDNPGGNEPSTDWLVEENVCWKGGDDGLDLRGNGIARRNTLWRWYDNGIAFTGPNTGRAQIYDNVLVDACQCLGGVDRDPLGTPSFVWLDGNLGSAASFRFDHNVYYDPQGNARWYDNRSGGPGEMTFPQWQAEGNDANGFNQSPAFFDSLETPLPNLHVASSGPCFENGEWQGTIGGLPTYDRRIYELSVPGAQRGDSASIVVLDENRSVLKNRRPGAVFRRGSSYLYDGPTPIDLEGDTRLFAEWRVAGDVYQETIFYQAPPCIKGSGEAQIVNVRDFDTGLAIVDAQVVIYTNFTFAQIYDQGRSEGALGQYVFLRDYDTNYFGIASVPTLYSSQFFQVPADGTGAIITVDLRSIPRQSATDPDKCVVEVFTFDFGGQILEGVLVEATFEGSGPFTGNLVLLETGVSDVTDSNGYAAVELIRSSEISTPDRIKTYTFTLTDPSNVGFEPQTYRGITVPDQSSANLADLLPGQ